MNKYVDEGIDLNSFSLEEELAKYEELTATGWSVVVRLLTSPAKKGSIYLTDKHREAESFLTSVGLVVKLGKGVYKDNRYADTGAWCKEGDWVVFPRHAGYKIEFKGIPLFVLKEDMVDVVVDNPTLIGIN